MTYDEYLDIVQRKTDEEWGMIRGRQGWEHGFLFSQWCDRLKWLITPPDPSTRTCLPGKHHWHMQSTPSVRNNGLVRETCCSCPRVRITQMEWDRKMGGGRGWWREMSSVIT